MRDRAEQFPQRTFLRFEDDHLTFAEFNTFANAFAGVLNLAGIGVGEVVALRMQSSPLRLAAQGAVAKTGVVGLLLDPSLRGEKLAQTLRASRARHVFTDAASLPEILEVPDAVTYTIWAQGDPATLPPHVEPLESALAAAIRSEPDLPDLRGRHAFLILCRATRTGTLPFQIVRHSDFLALGFVLSSLFGVGMEDTIYAPPPPGQEYNDFAGFAAAAQIGACFASRRRFVVNEFLSDVQRHRATVFLYSAEQCKELLRLPASPQDRDHLLRLALGGGLGMKDWEAFQSRFGVPELRDWYVTARGEVVLTNRAGRAGSVGRAQPFRHDQVRLARLDRETEKLQYDAGGRLVECDTDEPGELLVRCRDPRGDVPTTTIIRDAFRKGDAYLRTGDILQRDADSYFFVVESARREKPDRSQP